LHCVAVGKEATRGTTYCGGKGMLRRKAKKRRREENSALECVLE